jgi:hypothetical protein
VLEKDWLLEEQRRLATVEQSNNLNAYNYKSYSKFYLLPRLDQQQDCLVLVPMG